MKKLTSISFWLLLTLGMAATVFTSCSKDDKDDASITPTGISLDKTTLSLAVGEEYVLTATITPINATYTVTWSSSDPTIATVANGNVTAIAAGTVTITAQIGFQTVTSTVTVQPQPHVTTYTFGTTALPSDAQVKASADSTLVSEVDLKSDGISLGGMGSTSLKNKLSPKFAISSKVKGKGNLKDLSVDNQSDSLQLVAWGFTVNQ